MRVSCVLFVYVVFVVAVSRVSGEHQLLRVRALDGTAEAALDRGLSQSSLFRELVAHLEASNLIVHVMTTVSLPMQAAGTTRLSSSRPEFRYVRITVSAQLSREEQVAILAHELQHACEIAGSPARDTASVRALYQRIGQRVESWFEAYETTAAIDAGSTVWSDLHRRSRRATLEQLK